MTWAQGPSGPMGQWVHGPGPIWARAGPGPLGFDAEPSQKLRPGKK